MKKQSMDNKLTFNKSAVAELNDNQLLDVNGGATPTAFFYSVYISYIIVKDIKNN
ncbi:MAG TPA: class I lanthipeptide [Flavobacterium sp.]|jgi:hypothetical protein|nr:class I lanthipeptide [Flavobacterium sp.]